MQKKDLKYIISYFKNVAHSFVYLYQDYDILDCLNNVSKEIAKTLSEDGKIFFAGNGGSFADAQHLTAEFICKIKYR